MFYKVNTIYSLFSNSDKKLFILLLLFAVFTSLIEIIGITAIMPFINLIGDFSLIESNQYYNYFYNLFGFSTHVNYTIAFGLILIFFYIFRSIVNYFYFYSVIRFQNTQYELLSQKLFKIYMEQSYLSYINSNSSNLTKNIITEAYNYTLVIAAMLFIISEILIMFILYMILLYIDWKITLALTIFLGLSILFISKVISPKIKSAGNQRTSLQGVVYELISSSLGNFKILKLKDSDSLVLNKFNTRTSEMKSTFITNGSLNNFPRLFLEAFAFTFLLILIIYFLLVNNGNISEEIGAISVFILGLYRLMPSANRIITNYNQILFYSKTVDIIVDELQKKTEDTSLSNEDITFSNEIELKNIDFSYKDDKFIFKDANLKISKGNKVAFIGPSGCGKSTLIDIIIGLYSPKSGAILIDGTELSHKNLNSWRKQLGYIPQHIYLFEGSVAENVAMEDNIDRKKVKEVLEQAHILSFLDKEHEGIDTLVGEGGLKLSGGQRQRIAIARALYSNPEILILDEATSALDNTTEAEIMKNIYEISTDKTLLVIAHRLSTIEKCDKIYTINNCQISNYNKMDKENE